MSRLIDADELIAYCDKNWIPLNVDAVNAQQTVELQQWIPVSSGKLPENSITLVLVQIGEKCPDVELAFYDYNRECWENARHYQKIPDVVAWMPLPEPWKGGEA